MNETVDQQAEPSSLSEVVRPERAGHAAQTRQLGASAWFNPWVVLALLAMALAAWQWVETRIRLADTQQELARRLAESDSVAKESRLLARQAQEQISALHAKLGEMESKLAESKNQQETLESLYQDLARNRDEWALAEVEQGISLAAQQLQLAGNVQGAVLALQTADARLAASGKPQYTALRKAVTNDLSKLRALPQVDLTGMNLSLESAIAVVDSLPFAVDVRPRSEAKAGTQPQAAAASAPGFWRRLAADFWSEVRGLVRIQRFDRDEPALLAPGQAFFLRENLKLRLLNARLALLARDQWTFRNELRQAQSFVERYFDSHEPSVNNALATLKQLSSAEIAIELPTLNESLAAVKNVKPAKDGR